MTPTTRASRSSLVLLMGRLGELSVSEFTDDQMEHPQGCFACNLIQGAKDTNTKFQDFLEGGNYAEAFYARPL